MSNKSGTSPQVISLPTGGGAVDGIGETFSPDLFTGTGNLTVPLGLPAGRNGFQPELQLVYSTGNGNGPFGLGWDLSIPRVSRKTSKGVPRYRDSAADPAVHDTFVLAGAEDLVPVAQPQPGVTRFQPRTEGAFARIERVRPSGGGGGGGEGSDHWTVRTRDGVVHRYGAALPGRPGAVVPVVADPSDRSKVFCWKLSETSDPFGNLIQYEHLRDTGSAGPRHWDQLFVQRIRYVDHHRGDPGGAPQFLVTVSFVYEDRPDPFSDHRAGFEIRTRLRCRRVEVRTHADRDRLVRTYELAYLDDLVAAGERPASDLPLNGVSLLSRVRIVGHDGQATQELPPLELGYTRFAPERQRFQALEATRGGLPPTSLAADDLDTVDLFGDGLPDLVQLNGSGRFWRNLGGGRFDAPLDMGELPAGMRLGDPGVQVADMNGDGRADLLVLDRRGYYPLGFAGRWSPPGFVEYPAAPSVSFGADDLRLVDLDGDGVIDALRTGTQFELFLNDAERGWETVETRPRRPLAEFPDVSFSDPRVKLADLNGDGLQDIVLVDQGRIDYWPYLGHGRWGRRVTMGASPVFRDDPPFPGGFDPRRVLLGDVDGDGLDDLVYVQANRVTFWINQGGERWSAPITIEGTPPFTDVDGVRLTDVLGTGMAGVLWTNDPVPGTGSHYRFLDLTGGAKPYLLERVDNRRGAVTTVRYASSTSFYLADAARPATRWKTTLPFPVHVVDRVEAIDQISGGKLTRQYRYHHGYWDGVERELRGFGLVEQLDTESFADFHTGAGTSPGAGAGSAPGTGSSTTAFAAVEEEHFSPPVLTKTWFHQGPTGEEHEDWREPDRSSELWPEDPPALGHVAGVNAFLAGLPSRRARRDALRALAGQVLRTELYARDGTDREGRPHTVTELAYGLREESPPGPGPGDRDRPRVFFPHVVAERTSQWERGDEPMTRGRFLDDYDVYGQARRSVSLAAPRGRNYRVAGPAGQPYLGTVTTTSFAQRHDVDHYMVDRVARTTTHEILNDGRPALLTLRDAVRAGTAQLAVVGQTLSYYDGPAFQGLPLGRLGDFGASVRTETLVLTEDLLRAAYRSDEPGAPAVPPYLRPDGAPPWTGEYPEQFRQLVPPLAGYTFSPGEGGRVRGYFVQQTRHRYDVHDDPAAGRGLLLESRDPHGRPSSVAYDDFGLLPVRSTDAVALSATAVNDYRVLRPRLVTDVNGNRTACAFTPLGMVEHVAVMGKEGETVGDTPAAPSTRFVYDLLAAGAPGPAARPVSVRTIRRVRHVTDTDVPQAERDQTVEKVEYSDGLGRLIQTRVQGEHETFGGELRGDGVLPVAQDDPGTPQDVRGRRNPTPARPNVVVTGWRIFDNKGRVVEEYQPFFATGWDFAPAADAQLGQRIAFHYDPRGQLRRTVHPDGSETRVMPGVPLDLADPDRFRPTPWESFTYDANDNAMRTHAPGDVAGYEHHGGTPDSVVVDALGRPVTATQRTRPPRATPGAPLPAVEELRTHTSYDIRGNPLLVTDARGRSAFRYHYDLADRPLRSESLDAGVQRVIVDAAGREVERRDGKGALVLQVDDRRGRPSRVWARDDRSAPVTLRERVEYGDGGDPDQPAAERARARTANRLGTVHRHYDEAGLLTVERYDFKSRPVERSRQVVADGPLLDVFPDGADPSPDWQVTAFRVDWEPPAGDSLDEHAARLLDPRLYTTSTRYDAIDRVDTQQLPAGTTGERQELQLAYDRAGALAQVSLDGDSVVERIAYDANGQRTLVALGNGVMTRYAYDPRTLRLRRQRTEAYTKPASDGLTYRPAGGLLQDLAYRHDLVGNILDVVDRTPGSGVAANPEAGSVADPTLRALVARGDALVRRFAYDPLYRLVSATGRECPAPSRPEPWADAPRCGFGSGNHGTPDQDNAPQLTAVYGQAFSYDAVGNLSRLAHAGPASGSTRTFELVAGTNRLARAVSGQTAVPYTYDASGNLVGETTSRHFEWDHGNRMKAFRTQASPSSEPTVHAQYLYGSDGARVKKLVRTQGGAVEVTTYVDGSFEHHRWVRPGGGEAGANTTVHVTDGPQRVALIREGAPHPDDRGPAVRYLVADHLGSASLTVDLSGGFVNREEHTAYGETTFGSFARKRYRFCGQERDEESGLSAHGARYYAPYLARWTSPDPAGPVDGPNLYAYCRDNPVVAVDPSGTNSKKIEKQVKVEGKLRGRAQKAATLTRELDTARGAAHAAEGRLRAAEDALLHLSQDEPRFRDPRGGVDQEKFRAVKSHLEKWHSEAERGVREAARRVKTLELELDASTKALARARKQAHKLGLSITEIDSIEAEGASASLDEVFKSKKGGGGGDSGGGGGGGQGGPDGGGGGGSVDEPKILKDPPPTGDGGGSGSGASKSSGSPAGSSAGRAAADTAVERTSFFGKLAKHGSKAVKVVPFVGTGAAIASAAHNFREGEYLEGALDLVGLVPLVGDAVDAARLLPAPELPRIPTKEELRGLRGPPTLMRPPIPW